MKRFISVELVVLVSITLTVGAVVYGTSEAAPLDNSDAINKPLTADGTGRERSEAEIRDASRDYLAALQQGDGKAIAAFWTTHGIYVDSSGQSFPARELATQEFTSSAAEESRASSAGGNRILAKPGTIHWVTANVAIERGTITQAPADSGGPSEVHFLAVWVKQDNQWLLDYLQEIDGQKSSSPGKLGELEWMVGQWVTQGTGPTAQLTVSWSEGNKYLLQKFKVELPAQTELHGEQRIAWDPVRSTIRSWIFRSDGGFAESSWSQEGETWIVRIQGANAGGAKTSAINMWTPDGPDRCWFKSFRLSEGEASTDGMEEDEVILQFHRMITTVP